MRRVIGYSMLAMLWLVYVLTQPLVMLFEAVEILAESWTRSDQ